MALNLTPNRMRQSLSSTGLAISRRSGAAYRNAPSPDSLVDTAPVDVLVDRPKSSMIPSTLAPPLYNFSERGKYGVYEG